MLEYPFSLILFSGTLQLLTYYVLQAMYMKVLFLNCYP